jgi:pyruvate,water dikinase
VQGAVNPDEFYVYKPALRAGRPAILKRGIGGKAIKMIYTDDRTVGKTTEFVDVDVVDRGRLSLTDDEVLEQARQALVIEDHYGRPMDIEWGRDGADGRLYILQARPETVQSRTSAGTIQRYTLTDRGPVLVEGRAIGQRIGAGPVKVLTSVDQMSAFVPGEVLVADMTDPDWEPIMKRASAIVTNRADGPAMPPSSSAGSAFPPWLAPAPPPATLPTARRSPCRAPRVTPASSTTGCATSPSSPPSSPPCPTSRSRS